ncbi:bifunctional proline dehydrogenase/L-glutamate gamma-semialdehyde dehydrogenase [Agrococcus jejuensis]|uniref:bifunctional proline dehydrogenase/L-glutamate gamma-semialdehyde dehydrogenase n=1 Tax=Agrococcus jejuensis TaxID=399736 RepID=UPI0011A7B726|nr:bifunctional proline dehydrogenase/L-glutamate gamma-semialdehyde dehydrogenase [Agrococcus jejuensis]
MTSTQPIPTRTSEVAGLADEAIALVRRWLDESRTEPVDAAAQRLAGVLGDEHGLAFTVGFVDGVVRPEDPAVAARALRELVPLTPRFLAPPLRWAIALGGAVAPLAPRPVVAVARRVLRSMVRHLVVDATDARLGRTIRALRETEGVRLNVNLLGEAILGDEEAARRLEGTRALLARDDVDYVSIKVSSTVAPHSPWAFDEAVDDAVAALLPLYRLAATAGATKFINLDMEEYKDLDLTLAVFMRLLDEPDLHGLEAGVVIQAYLPDALGAMQRLRTWATARVDAGGAPIKVRVVKGANLPMERVDAEVHGWPLATWGSKVETDASYKAVLDDALHPEHVRAVRIGVAGHNLFDVALAWLLAERRGAAAGMDVEMLLGMATAQAAVVRHTVGSLLLYTPVVHPAEFDVAIAYLVRRLEEGASHENFMSAVFDLGDDPVLFARERDRFLAAIAAMPADVPAPARIQDRTVEPAPGPRGAFDNAPDTDPSIAANRAWGDGIRARMADSRLGLATAEAHVVRDPAGVDALVAETVAAGAGWRALGAVARAEILHRAGDVLERRRAELLEVMGAECGKVLEQGDPEVSEAIDFAHWYAEQGLAMQRIDGATPVPVGLTVVTPPWNFPVAIPAGSTLAALAAGSPVVVKPARQARRSGAVMVEALWEAGVPRDVLRYVQLGDSSLGSLLVGHAAVERVILTGGYETAERFRAIRPDLPLLAETSGKNAIVVTPSADLDLAARDVAASAFGHAGQKCSAASLVILVGSVATSERFRRQLVDAVRSMPVGLPWEGTSKVGPLIGPADGKLLHALTTLEPGERWVLEPERLDEAGTLWRPGIKEGVRPGSPFHLTEYFGPVLGIMTAATLDDAIGHVDAIEYGLTSGIHALDDDEVQRWLAGVQAGNLYVNRGTTGAIVRRQPFGGWKRAAVGAGTKAGGPSYLVGLTGWADATPAPSAQPADALAAAALAALGDAATPEESTWLRAALATDAVAWSEELGAVHDATGLEMEQNALRHQAVPVTVRAEHATAVEVVRIAAAGVRAGGALTVSVRDALPAGVVAWLEGSGATVAIEDAAAWAASAARIAETGGRVRLVGATAATTAAATNGSPAVALYVGPVLSAGRVELLAFLREQAVSISAHRFGTPRRHDVPALLPAR